MKITKLLTTEMENLKENLQKKNQYKNDMRNGVRKLESTNSRNVEEIKTLKYTETKRK